MVTDQSADNYTPEWIAPERHCRKGIGERAGTQDWGLIWHIWPVAPVLVAFGCVTVFLIGCDRTDRRKRA
jgi:hypothetical protein